MPPAGRHDDGVFTFSFAGADDGERLPPQVGMVEIEGITTDALIDTVDSVNMMDKITLWKLMTRPVMIPTKTQIYPCGCGRLCPYEESLRPL